jgi:hypothetical protein
VTGCPRKEGGERMPEVDGSGTLVQIFTCINRHISTMIHVRVFILSLPLNDGRRGGPGGLYVVWCRRPKAEGLWTVDGFCFLFWRGLLGKG